MHIQDFKQSSTGIRPDSPPDASLALRHGSYLNVLPYT